MIGLNREQEEIKENDHPRRTDLFVRSIELSLVLSRLRVGRLPLQEVCFYAPTSKAQVDG